MEMWLRVEVTHAIRSEILGAIERMEKRGSAEPIVMDTGACLVTIDPMLRAVRVEMDHDSSPEGETTLPLNEFVARLRACVPR